MANQIAITLESSDNEYLAYPCNGMLELFEIGTNGAVLVGVFRHYENGKQVGGPVEVRKIVFTYNHAAVSEIVHFGKAA